MKEARKLFMFLIMILGIFVLPFSALLIRDHGEIPWNFFFYPPTSTGNKPQYDPIYFYGFLVWGVITVTFILFPWWFGFKKRTVDYLPNKSKLPVWFWWGLLVHLLALVLLWFPFTNIGYFTYFLLIPLWWGFVFVLDGLVYRQNNSISPLVQNPRMILAMAFASTTGWGVFDYVNFFIDENWYYPNGNIINPTVFYTYGLFGASAFFPQIFEWMVLLKTSKYFNKRYAGGPVVRFPSYFFKGMFVSGYLFLFIVVFFREKLFFAIWLAPLFVVVGLLPLFEIWNPANPIRERGDWSILILAGIAGLIQGTLWEFWNYFSVEHCPWYAPGMCEGSATMNPAFWVYSIPYVDRFHLFEMPLPGYFGYIPFAIFYLYWHLTLSFISGRETMLMKYFRDD